MNKLILVFTFAILVVFPSYVLADPSTYLNIPPTNAFDKVHTNSGSVFAANFSMPLNIVGGPGVTVSANNSTHTVTITGTTSNGTTITALTCANNYQIHAVNSSGFFFCAPNNMTGTGGGTYNQTLANGVVINSGGFKFNFINGTGNPVNVKNAGNQVNVTISASGSSGINSINSQTGPAYNINCQTGNTTCTNSTNKIVIGFGVNPVIINGNAQTVSKALTLNQLFLGGNANGGNFDFSNLKNVNASKFYQNGNQVIDTLVQGSGISITGSGNSRTITNTGVLAAITSINGQLGPAIVIACQTGNTTCTNSTNKVTVGIGPNVVTGGSNIGHGGKGFFKGIITGQEQLRNLTSNRPDLVTLSQNQTDVIINSIFKALTSSCDPATQALGTYDNVTGKFTCINIANGFLLSINTDTTQAQIIKGANNANFSVTDNGIGTHTFNIGTSVAMINGSSQNLLSKKLTTPNINGQTVNQVTETSNYTVTSSDDIVLVNATSANVTITLPTAIGLSGHVFNIKRIDTSGGVNTVTIATTSSQTIDGFSTVLIRNANDYSKVISNNANWFVLDSRQATFGNFHEKFTSTSVNKYFTLPTTNRAESNVNVGANEMDAYAFLSPYTIKVSRIALVNDDSGAASCQAGIYNDNGNGFPGTLVTNSKSGAISALIGLQSNGFTSPITLDGNTVYWLTVWCNVSKNIQTGLSGTQLLAGPIGNPGAVGGTPAILSAYRATSISSPIPNTFPTNATAQGLALRPVFLRETG